MLVFIRSFSLSFFLSFLPIFISFIFNSFLYSLFFRSIFDSFSSTNFSFFCIWLIFLSFFLPIFFIVFSNCPLFRFLFLPFYFSLLFLCFLRKIFHSSCWGHVVYFFSLFLFLIFPFHTTIFSWQSFFNLLRVFLSLFRPFFISFLNSFTNHGFFPASPLLL